MNHSMRPSLEKLNEKGRARFSGPASIGLIPAVLLHGAGGSQFDEIFVFGGIGLIVLSLIYMSWRAGKKNKRNAARRRRRK